jgi:hypothetical protein
VGVEFVLDRETLAPATVETKAIVEALKVNVVSFPSIALRYFF